MPHSIQVETWRPVDDFDGYFPYEVSDMGKVRRVLKRGGHRVLRCNPGTAGYPDVRLSAPSGEDRLVRVHRLVARAFIGPCPDGCVINHIDFDRANNTPNNLEYVTQGDNARHTANHGRAPRGERSNLAKLGPDQVMEIRRRRACGERLGSIAVAFGVSKQNVCDICKGRSWKHLGSA